MASIDTVLKPLIVTPEEAEVLRPFGLEIQVLLTTERTAVPSL